MVAVGIHAHPTAVAQQAFDLLRPFVTPDGFQLAPDKRNQPVPKEFEYFADALMVVDGGHLDRFSRLKLIDHPPDAVGFTALNILKRGGTVEGIVWCL